MYSIDAHAHFNYTPGFFGNYGYGAKGTISGKYTKTLLIISHKLPNPKLFKKINEGF